MQKFSITIDPNTPANNRFLTCISSVVQQRLSARLEELGYRSLPCDPGTRKRKLVKQRPHHLLPACHFLTGLDHMLLSLQAWITCSSPYRPGSYAPLYQRSPTVSSCQMSPDA